MSDAPGGVGEVRAGFDEGRLADWMAANVAGFAGPMMVTQFKGGQSNPTYRIDTPGCAYVLRRKPPGRLLKGAHAVEREARVMAALGPTGFPVPRVHALCTDEDVIGTRFVVMDLVEGRIFWDPALPELPRDERAAVFDSMNATIAALHSLDPIAVGLGDYGRPENYLRRQIERWTRQYVEDTDAGRDPHMDRLAEWLPAHAPAGDESAIVHGDFRIDNLIFDPAEPRVAAVIDWELSTIGHPLADFAYHLMVYRMPSLGIAGLVGFDLAALGLPSEADYVADYCRRTGRQGIAELDFHLAFNLFRLAAICHGVKGRLARGNAVSQEAGKVADYVAPLAEIGWKQAQAVG